MILCVVHLVLLQCPRNHWLDMKPATAAAVQCGPPPSLLGGYCQLEVSFYDVLIVRLILIFMASFREFLVLIPIPSNAGLEKTRKTIVTIVEQRVNY